MFITAKVNQNNQYANHKEDKYMLKNQLFGVEVEMTGITRKKAALIVAEILSYRFGSILVICINSPYIEILSLIAFPSVRES